jgi:GWxTD domain-containing protein
VDPDLLGTSTCEYDASIDVKDLAPGSQLKPIHDGWASSCPMSDGAVAPALERFVFGIPAGTREVEVAVAVGPKGSNDQSRKVRKIRVQALPQKALVSDLILARMIGVLDSTNATQFNMRHNTIGIRGATDMVLEPESSDLWYYLEMYPAKGKPFNGNASMVVRRSSDNTELTRRELQKLVDVKVAQPIAGKVSLEGLPDGEYTFDVVLQLADTTVVSSHPFRMGMPAVVADAGSGAASGYFYTIPDNEIETTYGAAVMFNMTKQEVDLYNTLSTNAKRAFLTRMFGTAAPDPKRKPESALDAFLSRAQTVQAKYSERSGRGRMEGWKTDRGRIYIRRGEPTNLVSRPAARSGSPYEIFFYGNNRGLFYLFSDDTRAGNYRLIYTNDPQEQSLPNWDRHVGSEAVEDMRSMGIRVTVNGGNSGGQ